MYHILIQNKGPHGMIATYSDGIPQPIPSGAVAIAVPGIGQLDATLVKRLVERGADRLYVEARDEWRRGCKWHHGAAEMVREVMDRCRKYEEARR